ncbi:MAG: hypothetical protein ACE37I_01100 [Rubinisphaera brasiliensis]|uniref:HTH HARE-type domain-containing protein n=1 Tax=Rubinisphaera brasiliensis (strain ATCC 49424 / DSM 5305 / JCM 21570 / IAM 15109 / NBRC 103401 / IFAM 1448) TaxID=756272 RepID=F0SSQ3_RUBBR|nr:hypothetical protein [Rubinisphaera brasiliensis]ADY60369.1 hypothetical protein Plabr_2770 [Rubinisphaera brasiliensis DSM 5305]MBR9802084.1 hypothetical protein [bacterium]
MSEAAENLSVAELQQMLKKQQSRMNQLQKRRERLIEQIQEIDTEIAEISGGGETGNVRFRNSQSLEEVICDVLAKNKKGLGLAELTAAVEKTGYQSGSNNFKNVVYQNVYKSEHVTRDEKTGKYVLA